MTQATNNLVLVPGVEEAKKALIFLESCFLGVLEKGGANRGPEVEMFQRSIGGAPGDSWCMESQAWFVRRIGTNYNIAIKMYRSASCQEVWDKTPANCKIDHPEIGTIVIWLDGDGTGHTGLVAGTYDDGRFVTIEGNAHGDQGDGIYRLVHTMTPSQTGRKVAGFIRPFG